MGGNVEGREDWLPLVMPILRCRQSGRLIRRLCRRLALRLEYEQERRARTPHREEKKR